jgi:hypothetical protein
MKRLGVSGAQRWRAEWLTFCMREFVMCGLDLEIITLLVLACSPGRR